MDFIKPVIQILDVSILNLIKIYIYKTYIKDYIFIFKIYICYCDYSTVVLWSKVVYTYILKTPVFQFSFLGSLDFKE